jgi:hypothetical protein
MAINCIKRTEEEKQRKGKGKAILKVVGQFAVHLPKATMEFSS